MFFINMQAHYDAEFAREKLASELPGIERIAETPASMPEVRNSPTIAGYGTRRRANVV
jgi:hypothetical protein